MEYYNLAFDKFIWRFYLMMAVVIGSFFIGLPFLAILSVPIFLSNMMGLSFKAYKERPGSDNNTIVIQSKYSTSQAA